MTVSYRLATCGMKGSLCTCSVRQYVLTDRWRSEMKSEETSAGLTQRS